LKTALRAATVVALTMTAGSCGGGDAPPTGPNPPGNAYRITIGANGVVSPTELVVPPGTRVLFTNNHTVPHDMTSDPHPEHNLCPEINQVGLLTAGQSRETGNLVVLRTCGFHDHNDFQNPSLLGRIIVR
jgi:plastocyanin